MRLGRMDGFYSLGTDFWKKLKTQGMKTKSPGYTSWSDDSRESQTEGKLRVMCWKGGDSWSQEGLRRPSCSPVTCDQWPAGRVTHRSPAWGSSSPYTIPHGFSKDRTTPESYIPIVSPVSNLQGELCVLLENFWIIYYITGSLMRINWCAN